MITPRFPVPSVSQTPPGGMTFEACLSACVCVCVLGHINRATQQHTSGSILHVPKVRKLRSLPAARQDKTTRWGSTFARVSFGWLQLKRSYYAHIWSYIICLPHPPSHLRRYTLLCIRLTTTCHYEEVWVKFDESRR